METVVSTAKNQTRLVSDLVAVPYQGQRGVFLASEGGSLIGLPMGRRPHRDIECAGALPVARRRPVAVMSAIEYVANPFVGVFRGTGYEGQYSAGDEHVQIQFPHKLMLQATSGTELVCWVYPADAPAGVYALIPFLHEGSAYVFRLAGQDAAEDAEIAQAESRARERAAEELRQEQARQEATRFADEEARKTLIGTWGVYGMDGDQPWLMLKITYTAEGRYQLEYSGDLYSTCRNCREYGSWIVNNRSIIRTKDNGERYSQEILEMDRDSYSWSQGGLSGGGYQARRISADGVAMVANAPDTKATSAAAVDVPNSFLGEWSGEVSQGNEHYPVTMSLQRPPEGLISGTIDYPTLNCSGVLQFKRQEQSVSVVEEIIKNGGCISGGQIRLQLSDADHLSWSWFYANGQLGATAILTRN